MYSKIPDIKKKNQYRVIKRLLDIFVSLFAILVFSPLALLIPIFIILIDGFPVFYSQERVGLKGKSFMLYKFRTMILEAEDDSGPVLAEKNDIRVTEVGKYLRRTRLDELPQLANVLKGDMSLVGPRPERPYFVKQHKSLQGIRLSVLPGLTGVAQVEAYYHTHPRNKLRYDYLYIKNRSILLDIKIMLKTILVILTKPGS